MINSVITVTVVLCTYNRAEQLGIALASLTKQMLSKGQLFEVVVVDDGSTDYTPSVVRKIAASSEVVRHVRVPHGGVAAARNAGVRHARGEWIAFFDDDQEAEPGWLSELVRRAEESGADCVAGRIKVVLLDVPEAKPTSTVLKLLGDNGFMDAKTSESSVGNANILPGTGNALARRALFDRCGPFDAAITYGEDGEWFRRVRRMGARIVYAPEAVVLHLTPPSRLTATYLFSVAIRGAIARASDDLKDGGVGAVLKVSALRIGHTVFVSGPCLALAHLRGGREEALGRACSLRYSIAYIREVARLLITRRSPGHGYALVRQ